MSCRRIFILIALTVLASGGAAAQTGRVTLRGTLSETVALSALPDIDVVRTANDVRITLSGDDNDAPVVRVHLLVRSNTGFRISAALESETAAVTQLSIVGVRATGSLVSPQAVSEINVPRQFDEREADKPSAATSLLETSHPFVIVTGPRVSLGGTLDSANNALQITVLIRVKPQSSGRWLAYLTFAGAVDTSVR